MNVSFNDLLKIPIELVSTDIPSNIISDEYECRINRTKLIDENRLTVNYIKKHCFDGNREWNLGYIKLDDDVILFFYNYGRGGKDGYGHDYLTVESETKFNKYIESLCDFEEWEIKRYINDLNSNADHYTKFYNQSLFDEFKYEDRSLNRYINK